MKKAIHRGGGSKIPAVVDTAEAIGLVALILAALLALAVAVVPAAESGEPPASTPPAVVPDPGAAAPSGVAPAVDAAPPDVAMRGATDAFVVRSDTSLVFELEVGNRMYPEWHETRQVRLQEEFWLGDTENSAVVTALLPDFRIIDGAPRSLSAALANPAVRVFVRLQGAAIDSSWAFLNFPPHFSPRSFYTFQLKNISGYPVVEPEAAAAGDAKADMVKRTAAEQE